MTPAAILEDLSTRGITCRVDEAGNLRVSPASSVTPELRTLLLDHKPALVRELSAAAKRREVLALLRERPEIERAFIVDGDIEPVRVALAVRGIGTAELVVPARSFDPFAFLQLLEAQGGTA